jgi:uncharacterized protein YbcV (DUF1398 family)
MNTAIIANCMALSFADTPFPAIVRELADAGVRAYHADLTMLRNTYYDSGSASFDEALPLTNAPFIAEDFNQPGIAESVGAIQRGEIGYADFLRRIMRAGCARYCVFFEGRKVMYFGRQGDVHTEHFPPPRT